MSIVRSDIPIPLNVPNIKHTIATDILSIVFCRRVGSLLELHTAFLGCSSAELACSLPIDCILIDTVRQLVCIVKLGASLRAIGWLICGAEELSARLLTAIAPTFIVRGWFLLCSEAALILYC